MTPIQPPRWAVRLLESFGADPAFRDDVIGDMAEEFALRQTYDGEPAARRWYVREAWRTFPYLVRDWARRFRRRDFAYLANVVFASYLIVVVVGGIAFVALRAFLATLGIDIGTPPLPWTKPTFLHVAVPLIMLLGIGSGVFGGYVAARLGRRAPLISAFALGVFWVSVSLCAVAIGAATHVLSPLPLWWIMVQPVVLLACTTAGGALRVWTATPATDNAERIE